MTRPRLLVTGATGFIGRWVLRHWRKSHPDVELWATSDRPEPPDDAHHYCQLDLGDAAGVNAFVADCRPRQVIHLAGLTGAAPLERHLAVNVLGTENLYRALAAPGRDPDLVILQAGSAAAYGLVRSDELPITEEQTPRPIGAYGISKLAQDHVAATLTHSTGVPVICARIFNILGPGQPDSLVPAAFLTQLTAVRAGRAERIRTGNLEPRRDFVDVRDVVEAFDALLAGGVPAGIYNIASGVDTSIGELLDMLMAVGSVRAPVEPDPARMRSVDVPCVRGSTARTRAVARWNARRSLTETLRDMWRHDAGTANA